MPFVHSCKEILGHLGSRNDTCDTRYTCACMYIDNTRVCTSERERKAYARAFARAETCRRTRLRHSARRTNTHDVVPHGKWQADVFELDSTRKYFTRVNTRRDGSYRFLFLSFSLPRSLVARRENFLPRFVLRNPSNVKTRFRVESFYGVVCVWGYHPIFFFIRDSKILLLRFLRN